MTLLSILFDFICLANSSTKTCIPANVINEALEHVVDSIEPKMRYFPGYKKILNKGVATSLAYISNLVDTIPGPLFISSRTFTTDPQVNAYFATVADTQAVFSNSTELRDFFEAQENAALEDVYALLCMDVEEKTVMGMDLHKDIIRRDVMQTALSFSEHKILSPATNEADVRKGIKQCIFDGLITHALQQILEIKQQKLGLEIQRNKLTSRLRARQSQGGGLSSLLASVTETKISEDIQQKISDNEKMLQKLPTSWDAPRYYLEIIKNTLSQPGNFISIKDTSFDVTRMGIVSNVDTSQTVNTININKILIANVLQRAVAIVHYPHSEILPKREFNL